MYKDSLVRMLCIIAAVLAYIPVGYCYDIHFTEGSYCIIKHASSKKVLSAGGNAWNTNGGKISVEDYSAQEYQIWKIEYVPGSNVYFRLINAMSGKSLNIGATTPVEGNLATLYEYDQGCQKMDWNIDHVSTNGGEYEYKIIHRRGTGLVLSVETEIPENGSSTAIYSWENISKMKWIITELPGYTPENDILHNHYFRISLVSSPDMALSVGNDDWNSNGTTAGLWTYNNKRARSG